MQITRTFDFLYHQNEACPQKESFGSKTKDGWKFFSSVEMLQMSRELACGLIEIGIQQGDRVGMIAYKNLPEWVILDMALAQLGVVSVPVYPTISSREYAYIFGESEISYCFVGEGDLYDKVEAIRDTVGSIKDIYTFNHQEGRKNWMDLFSNGSMSKLDQIKETIQPDDVATIIYTSGTTGNPKGVMLTHNNICTNVLTIIPDIPIKPGHTTLSFLPMCHVFERVVSYAYIYVGAKVYFTGTDNLGGEEGDLKNVKPYFFTAVPRLLEKVYDKLYAKGLSLPLPLKALFFWALRLTDDFEFDVKHTGFGAFKRKIADKLIYKKWREALGGNVQGIIVGSAPCPERILRTFSAAGIPVYEGYGLSESSPGISINGISAGTAKIGTVGRVIKGSEVRIYREEGDYRENEGEIIMHGPNIMAGYYKNPQATAETIREIDGKKWLFTGDIGKFVTDENGIQFLKITDRKKELLKTSNGKYVAPSHIEVALKESFLIEQAMVVGDNKKFVSALVVPFGEGLKSWCERKQITWNGLEQAIKEKVIIDRYQRAIDDINKNLSKTEQIKKFTLVKESWEPIKKDGTEAELTPTLKLKRRVILEKYASLIDLMYA